MISETLEKIIQETREVFDQRTTQGKHFANEVTRYANDHPQSSVKDILFYIIARSKVNGIEKITDLNVTLREIAQSAETHQHIGQCVFCKKKIRHGARFSCTANGQTLNMGENGDLVSLDKCWENLLYISLASKDTDFNMENLTEEKKSSHYERIEKVNIPISTLSKKAIESIKNNIDLKRYGIDLESEIKASVADEIQRQIFGGDISGLLRNADSASFKDTIKWAIAHKEGIYSPEALKAITLIENRPDAVKNDDLITLFLYEFQERMLQLEGELSGIKDDIIYLSKLGETNLTTKLPPIKLFPYARRRHNTLADILDQNGKPIDSVTKAEATAVRLAVPRLREKRAEHNRKILDRYCTPQEWTKITNHLYNTYNAEKDKYWKAKKEKEKKPETIWKKPTYLALKDFFEKMEAAKAAKDITFRETFIRYIFMPKAKDTAELIFVEGQKLQGWANPRKEYTSLINASEEYAKTPEELIDIYNKSKGIPNDPTSAKKLAKKKFGLRDITTLNKSFEYITFGIVTEKRPKKENLLSIEEALKPFEYSPETTQKANYLCHVQESKYSKDVEKDWNGTQIMPRNIKTFKEKTHFTTEQQKTIEYAYKAVASQFPKNCQLPEEVDKKYEEITQFLKTHTILDGSLFIDKQELKAADASECDLHQKRNLIDICAQPENLPKITNETAKKIRTLINIKNSNSQKNSQLYENIQKMNNEKLEQHILDPNVRVTQSWLDNLESWYSQVK